MVQTKTIVSPVHISIVGLLPSLNSLVNGMVIMIIMSVGDIHHPLCILLSGSLPNICSTFVYLEIFLKYNLSSN